MAATAAAATINGYTPLSTTKISEKRKIIEEIALSDVKKVSFRTDYFLSFFTFLHDITDEAASNCLKLINVSRSY